LYLSLDLGQPCNSNLGYGLFGLFQVQTAFLALAEATVLRPYMRQAVAEISEACVAFEGKDCAPASARKLFTLLSCSLMIQYERLMMQEE
jgi:hypothetical protein